MVSAINGPPVLNGSAYIYPSATLAELRNDLLTLLGFPDPLTGLDSERRTLGYLREAVYRGIGRYYNPLGNPPGADEQIDIWINEAQQTIFRLIEMDQAGGAFPTVMAADIDLTTFDYVPILALSIGIAKAHNGQEDSKIYFDEFKKYLDDRIQRRPPNIIALTGSWLKRAQKHLYQKYKVLRTELWWKIPILQGQRIYDVPSISSGALTDVSFDAVTGTISRTTGSWFTDGFTVGTRIKAFGAVNAANNNTQWEITSLTALVMTFTVSTGMVTEAAGASITINAQNYISLDFRTATEAWLEDDGRWISLKSGMDASLFNITHETTPTHWEMREFFEVFPTPNQAYVAWVKGHFGLKPFDADNDITTIDPESVLLQALVWGKMHLRHPDALAQARELEDYVSRLNAGRHAGIRYIPNSSEAPVALAYPKVTFART